MSESLIVRAGVFVPADAIEMRAVRSGGPGGQNVNKVATKVELRVDLSRIVGLDHAARDRLRAIVGRAVDASGRLVVTSQRTRDQSINLADARAKVLQLVERSLVRPRLRKKTKPSRSSVERRIEDKKRRGRVKATRRDADG